jgi:hypothetical protein
MYPTRIKDHILFIALEGDYKASKIYNNILTCLNNWQPPNITFPQRTKESLVEIITKFPLSTDPNRLVSFIQTRTLGWSNLNNDDNLKSWNSLRNLIHNYKQSGPLRIVVCMHTPSGGINKQFQILNHIFNKLVSTYLFLTPNVGDLSNGEKNLINDNSVIAKPYAILTCDDDDILTETNKQQYSTIVQTLARMPPL